MKDRKNVHVLSLSVDEVCFFSFAYTLTIRCDEPRGIISIACQKHYGCLRKKMFSDCSRFSTVCLFVNWSAWIAEFEYELTKVNDLI